jgi:hypothetical protein
VHALDELPRDHALVAKLGEIVGDVEGAIAVAHQRPCLLHVRQLCFKIKLRLYHIFSLLQHLTVEPDRSLVDIALLEIANHVVFGLVDEPHIVLGPHLQRRQQDLHDRLSIILQ